MINLLLVFLLQTNAQVDGSETMELDRIYINDTLQEKLQNLTAPDEISKKDLEKNKQTDVMRALKQVSGTYMREEDGQGLRPNIGLRGTHPDRSKKIVLMEDEVLIVPAPYAAPAAYFTPSLQTTESLQVFKGFASVPWGPNSIGGSINYITKQIPREGYQKVDASYGSFNTQLISVEGGDSVNDKLGFLVSGSRLSSDGFKILPDNQNTGFVKNDFLVKASWNFSNRHYLKAKVGFSSEDSNETYLGLTASDFSQNSYQRYASSALDKMDWQHQRYQMEHGLQISDNSFLKTLAYFNSFDRTWFRLDSFQNANRTLRDVLNNPAGSNALYYDVLRGTRDSSTLGTNGNLLIANNQRSYQSYGLQSTYSLNSDFTVVKNELLWGGRLHSDYIERDHTLHTSAMSQGTLALTGDIARGTLDKNQATAISTFIENNMSLGDFKWTVVGRYENIHFRDRNKINNDVAEARDEFFVPGVGISYKITPELAVKTSVNRALNVAGLSSFGRNEREKAMNYEAGLRYNTANSNIDLNFFFNDYDNITGTCSASTGCLTDSDVQFNGGQAKVYGMELSAFTQQYVGAVKIPLQTSITLMSAEFANTFQSESPEWGTGTVAAGSRLPYIPQVQYNASVGVEYKKVRTDLNFMYQGNVVDQSFSQNQIKVGGFGVVDIISRYNYSKKGSFYVKADNVLGLDYVVAARPFGLRPGKPQAFGVGITQTF